MVTPNKTQSNFLSYHKKILPLIVLGTLFCGFTLITSERFYLQPAFYIGVVAAILGIVLLLLELRASLRVLPADHHGREVHYFIGPLILLLFSIATIVYFIKQLQTNFHIIVAAIIPIATFWGYMSYKVLLRNMLEARITIMSINKSKTDREKPFTDTTFEYDFFISHASEDKDEIVRPLVSGLSKHGVRVWYDEFTLTIGDSLRRSIDYGLRHSRYGIVILSKAFFSKNWTQYELDGLTILQMKRRKVILPVWHGVDHAYISQYSPSLADKVAFNSSAMTVDELVDRFVKFLKSDEKNGTFQSRPDV